MSLRERGGVKEGLERLKRRGNILISKTKIKNLTLNFDQECDIIKVSNCEVENEQKFLE